VRAMRPRTILPLLFILTLVAPAVAAGRPLDAATRDFDQLHLAVRVEPDIAAGTIAGQVDLRFASLVPGLATLRLHAVDLTVKSVESAGLRLAFRVLPGILEIDLAAPLAKGAEAAVRIEYDAKPRRGLWFHAPTERHPHVPLSFYSQGQGTDNRHWIPCYDLSDDRLTSEIRVVVPKELATVSNGRLAEQKVLGDGRREDVWRMEQRHPTYLIGLAAGPYETWSAEHGGVEVEINAFPGRLEEARNAFGRVTEMLDFFGEYLGAPYPYGRYAQTVVWDFLYGGMENTTATTMNMRLPHGPETRPVFDADGITAHELAHQWFGDWLTCRSWRHIWLNEGFATYLTDLFFEHEDGEIEFRIRRRRQNRGYLDGTPKPETLGLDRDPRGDVPLELFGGKQYNRGAAILHQLRLEIGDEVFRKALGRYAREHADSAVTTEDLRRSVEREAGRDLAWFFDQWDYGAGYPVLDVRYERLEGEGDLLLRVKQVQVAGGGQTGAFRLTLPVRVALHGGGSVVRRLLLTRREQEFRVPCPGSAPPAHVRVDDGVWLLGRVILDQSRESWQHQLLNDPDVGARLDAIEALAPLEEQVAGTLAQALAADAVWAVRVAAARALGERSGSEAALAALLAARTDADARVRETVYGALGGRTRDEAGAVVAKGVTEEAHPYVRAAAARALGRLHTEDAFGLLRGLLEVGSHREVVRHGALDGLASLGDPRAVDLAIPFLDYEWGLGAMSMMRKAALDLVTKLEPDERRTRKLLTDLLDDPYFRMRGWAADACGTYRVAEALPRLRRMAEEESHWDPKGAARRAIEKLAGDGEEDD